MSHYTGVGSRKTPRDILALMTAIAVYARSKGVILRSGGAIGADRAFEKGSGSFNEIFYASDATSAAAEIAREFHPAWDRCSGYARALHARNVFQVLGRNLTDPSLCLICWTPDGCVSHTTRSQKTGGTGTAISIAERYNVKIYNLYRPEHLDLWKRIIKKKDELMRNKIGDIEVRWAKQLQREHGRICYQQGVSLSKPVISIVSGKQRLAYWRPRNKSISVSKDLIKTHPWEIVLEIFKHEMAHQYVSEYYNDADIHGECFKTACKFLGVHPAFSGSRCNQEQIDAFMGTLPEKAQKMLRRVEKLLALGQSSNESEAQAASKKANYLLNKYNLKRIAKDETKPSDVKYLYLRTNKKRLETIEKQILGFLEEYYFVDCIIASIYDADADEEYKAGVLIGKKESLVVAEYVYRFLLSSSKELWKDFRKKHSGQRTGKVAFDLGFLKGIRTNHEAMFKGHDDIKINGDASLPVAAIKALRNTCKAENNSERKRLFPRIRKQKASFRKDTNAFFQGFIQGKNTHINRPVEHKKAGTSALLGM